MYFCTNAIVSPFFQTIYKSDREPEVRPLQIHWCKRQAQTAERPTVASGSDTTLYAGNETKVWGLEMCSNVIIHILILFWLIIFRYSQRVRNTSET